MRTAFHEELDHLEDQLMCLGRMVSEAVDLSIQAMLGGDRKLANAVIAGDEDINAITLRIERIILALQAREQPVAIDLRFLHTTLLYSIHLERIGDLSVNISKIAKRLIDVEHIEDYQALLKRMAAQVVVVLETAMRAYEERDAELSKTLSTLDQPVDELFKEVLGKLSHTPHPLSGESHATDISLAARYLERMADQAVDAASRVEFMVTGELAGAYP